MTYQITTNLFQVNLKFILIKSTMIFNFTNKYQFTTRLSLGDVNIQVVNESKLLGTHITDDLKWDTNTNHIIKRAYSRMELLRKVSSFCNDQSDLKDIYIQYIWSILEFSCTVWNSSITLDNKHDLERVQKCAVRIILGHNYSDYGHGLQALGLETLEERREKLCLTFARKCLKNDKMKHLFPINYKSHKMETRNSDKYYIQFAHTKRLQNSPIIYMQRLLNQWLKHPRFSFTCE